MSEHLCSRYMYIRIRVIRWNKYAIRMHSYIRHESEVFRMQATYASRNNPTTQNDSTRVPRALQLQQRTHSPTFLALTCTHSSRIEKFAASLVHQCPIHISTIYRCAFTCYIIWFSDKTWLDKFGFGKSQRKVTEDRADNFKDMMETWPFSFSMINLFFK